MILVYMKWNGQVYAQLWSEELTDGHGRSPYQADVIFKKPLSSDEYNLSFAQLKKKYPAPELKES